MCHFARVPTKRETVFDMVTSSDMVTSEEEQKNIQKSIDYINELRFILKMSPTNKSIINRVLTFIESPIDYQGIVEDVLSKIESNEI